MGQARYTDFRTLPTDGKKTATARIETPQALTLEREPLANTSRYDALRGEIRHAS